MFCCHFLNGDNYRDVVLFSLFIPLKRGQLLKVREVFVPRGTHFQEPFLKERIYSPRSKLFPLRVTSTEMGSSYKICRVSTYTSTPIYLRYFSSFFHRICWELD